MTSPASLSRPAIQIGPGTYALRPAGRGRQNTWRRWHRVAAALKHSSTGEQFECPDCGGMYYVSQFEFAHYPDTPKAHSPSRGSVFSSGNVTRKSLSPEDIEVLGHGRFICANCHALETSVQQLGKEWDNDIVFSTADAQSRWSQARNTRLPAHEADPQLVGQPPPGVRTSAG